MIGRKQTLKLLESEVIDILVNWKYLKTGEPNLNHFIHILYPPEDDLPVYPYKGVYIAKEMLRQEFGLPIGKDIKPGDFDIIIIPYDDDNIYYSKTCVYEVKVNRPTNKKPNASAKTNGVDQINGLIKDGFPYISLIYVTVSEPVTDNKLIYIDKCMTPANSGISSIFDIDGNLLSTPIALDSLDYYSVDNQMRKLMSFALPRFVGLKSISLGMNVKGQLVISESNQLYKNFESGYRNFNIRAVNKMIKRIANHHNRYSEKYQKIKFVYK